MLIGLPERDTGADMEPEGQTHHLNSYLLSLWLCLHSGESKHLSFKQDTDTDDPQCDLQKPRAATFQ